MLDRIRAFAHRHPSLFSGAWFAASVLLLASPVGAMILLLLGLEVLAGRPAGAYLAMAFASVGLPPIPAFAMGALVGPRILRLPPSKHVHAAGWGAAAALGALVLWALLLEGLPRLFVGGAPASGGGDVPGAAAVVGYLVVLPLIVVLSLLVGAAAGVLLQVTVTRHAASSA